MSNQKTTRVGGDESTPSTPSGGTTFVASTESKGKAKQLRLFAILAWVVAMAGQVFAIFNLIKDETLVWLIVAIVVILALAITGSTLWKKANRLDPASEKDKVKFFIQNQLGAILGVLAFLPLVIMIFLNKNIDGKTKGIAGTIAVIAMLAAGITGIDFDPPSIEKYTKDIQEQTQVLKTLNLDNDQVYWSRAGNRYHIYEDCQHIRDRELSNGTVKDSWEEKGISELCKTCQSRAMREKNISDQDLEQVKQSLEQIIE
jgi:hypothetical protein